MKTIEEMESELEILKKAHCIIIDDGYSAGIVCESIHKRQYKLAEAKKPKFGPDEIVTVEIVNSEVATVGRAYCGFYKEYKSCPKSYLLRRITPRELKPTLEALGVIWIWTDSEGMTLAEWVERSER